VPSLAAANIVPVPFPATSAEAVTPARKEARADVRPAAALEKAEEKVTVAGAVRSREAPGASAKSAGPAALPPTTPPALGAAQSPMLKPLAPAALSDAAGGTGARGLPVGEDKASGKLDENELPGPWLKRLLDLREQGKFKELREELARFRKVHPDVVLPKSLTELPAG
jgi:hypothetical protein